MAVTKGARRMVAAGMPSSRWIMVLLPAMVALTISLRLDLRSVLAKPTSGALAGRLDQAVDGVQHQFAQLLPAAVLAGVDDARDHILAAGDLAVVFGDLGLHLPADQIDQPDGDGGGADVDRQLPTAVRRPVPARAADRSAIPRWRLAVGRASLQLSSDGGHLPVCHRAAPRPACAAVGRRRL